MNLLTNIFDQFDTLSQKEQRMTTEITAPKYEFVKTLGQ